MQAAVIERDELTEPVSPVAASSSADRFMRRLLRVSERTKSGAAAEGRSALGASIFVSGIRCFFTYLVFPLLGPGVGLAGSANLLITLVLATLAVVFSVRSMRRFWSANHRHRWAYSAFAGVVIAWVAVDLTLRAFL